MKAVVYTRYGSPNVLRFMDVEKPAPKRTFRDGSVELLVLLRHCSRLTWLHARRYGAARFPHAGLIPWKGDGRWADFPAAVRPHPRVGVAVDQRELVPHLHPPRHDIQPWLRPVRWNPAPCRQHTPWSCPASRREDVARLGGNPSAIPRRTLGHTVPAPRGKRPFAAPTQAWSSHPCIIDRAVGSVEVSWPWWPSEGVEADDRAGQHGQRVEAFRAALVADDGAGGQPVPPRPWPRSPPPAVDGGVGVRAQVGPAGLARLLVQPGRHGQAEQDQRPQRPRQPGRPPARRWRSAARGHPHGRPHARPLVPVTVPASSVTCKCGRPASRDRYRRRVLRMHGSDVRRHRPLTPKGSETASKEFAPEGSRRTMGPVTAERFLNTYHNASTHRARTFLRSRSVRRIRCEG
jgi:hypothetical protein